MEGNYRIATIMFLDEEREKTYRYALYNEDVVPGDICVVKSAHHGMGIARIVDIEPKTDEKIAREIVCKCDFSLYETREERRKRRESLKNKMAKRAAELQEIALYQMMANNDPTMGDMLREFEELGDC